MGRLDLIQIRADTAANWASVNPVLANDSNGVEIGIETDTRRVKLGDGSTAYNSLPYAWQPVLVPTGVKTANYTAVKGDHVRCDPSSGGFTVTLPVSDASGIPIVVKNKTSSTNAITVARSGSDTIDGATSVTMNIAYQCMTFVPVSGGWDVR